MRMVREMNRDEFSTLHPIINFYFYVFIIIATMIFMQPVFLIIALVSSMSYALFLNKKKTLKFSILGLLPVMLIGVALNPMFNHQGITILTYLPDGNPLTLESIVYGIAAAFMFASVITWFGCYNQTMSSDKFLYLFGRISPKLSLVISMSLRFIPLYQNQIASIRQSQMAIGRDLNNGNWWQKTKNGLHIFSIFVTWALENAITTSDSMQARGYGLSGRTNFSVYRFDSRDVKLFSIMIAMSAFVLIGAYFGYNTMKYYPAIRLKKIDIWSVIFYLNYALFCNIPLVINLVEERKWRYTVSKI